jgi:hypothetical protein
MPNTPQRYPKTNSAISDEVFQIIAENVQRMVRVFADRRRELGYSMPVPIYITGLDGQRRIKECMCIGITKDGHECDVRAMTALHLPCCLTHVGSFIREWNREYPQDTDITKANYIAYGNQLRREQGEGSIYSFSDRGSEMSVDDQPARAVAVTPPGRSIAATRASSIASFARDAPHLGQTFDFNTVSKSLKKEVANKSPAIDEEPAFVIRADLDSEGTEYKVSVEDDENMNRAQLRQKYARPLQPRPGYVIRSDLGPRPIEVTEEDDESMSKAELKAKYCRK